MSSRTLPASGSSLNPFLAFHRPLVVGEVAQAHEGSLALAHAFINVIADSGADAVKFQTHIAAAESTPAEPWRVRFTPQDSSRYDYWRRMEFSAEQWAGLRQCAHARGLRFLSSPFSIEAADLLARVGVDAWKVASGEIANDALMDRVLADGRPIVLSTGMSPLHEIDAAVARVQAAGRPLALLQCTSAYPASAEQVGLNLLDAFRTRYGCPVGLSDHSGTIFPSLAAADASIIAALADATVLVVRAGQTHEDEARHALAQLYAVGARIAGAVLNDQNATVRRYDGYYYTGYYGGPESS